MQWSIGPLKKRTMDKEKYNRVIAISNHLSQLKEVKKELKDTCSHYLTYAKKAATLRDSDSVCPDWIMKNIRVILDKYDKMIRQEIDDEIAALNKEIEEL